MLVSDGAASLVDIARQARLYASSCKEGHRVEAVLDRNGETYWQYRRAWRARGFGTN